MNSDVTPDTALRAYLRVVANPDVTPEEVFVALAQLTDEDRALISDTRRTVRATVADWLAANARKIREDRAIVVAADLLDELADNMRGLE